MISPSASTVIAFPEAEVTLLDAYLRGLPSQGTRRAYRRAITAFDAFLSDRDLLTATRRDVEAYRSHLEALGRAPATVAKVLSALAGFFDFAVDEGEVERNPAARARRPKVPDCSPRVGLTQVEVRTLLAVPDVDTLIGLRDRPFLLVLAVQAWRVSEAVGLRVEDLGEEQGHKVATIRAKGGRVRRVTLTGVAWLAITTWCEAATITEGPIFVAVAKGGHIKQTKAMSRTSAWKRVRCQAPPSWDPLRATI